MKSHIIIMITITIAPLLWAAPNTVDLSKYWNSSTRAYKPVVNQYVLVKSVPYPPVKNMPQGYSRKQFFNNPYFIGQDDNFRLEMRDTSGVVLWSKSINDGAAKRASAGYSSVYKQFAYGKYINAEGTVVMRDKPNSRYYFYSKEGKTIYLPKGTSELISLGMVTDKYWLFGTGINSEGNYGKATDEKVNNSHYFTTGKGFVLFTVDGTEYKKIDVNCPGYIMSYSLPPDYSKLLVTWMDMNTGKFGTYLMKTDGSVLKDYQTNFEANGAWSPSGDLFCGQGSGQIINSTTLEPEAEFINLVDYQGQSLLSDKSAGIWIHQEYDQIIVLNYYTDKLLAVFNIPEEKPYVINSISGDGKEITFTDEECIKTYRIP